MSATNQMYYILGNDGRTPVACDDLEIWAQWYEASGIEGRRVAVNEFADGAVRISTVFLGVAVGAGTPPMLFETAVEGGPTDGCRDRYASYEAAQKGHELHCEAIKVLQEALGDRAEEVFRAGREAAGAAPAANYMPLPGLHITPAMPGESMFSIPFRTQLVRIGEPGTGAPVPTAPMVETKLHSLVDIKALWDAPTAITPEEAGALAVLVPAEEFSLLVTAGLLFMRMAKEIGAKALLEALDNEPKALTHMLYIGEHVRLLGTDVVDAMLIQRYGAEEVEKARAAARREHGGTAAAPPAGWPWSKRP